MATVPVRISTRGLVRFILGLLCHVATHAVLIMLIVFSGVVGICKIPKPNLRVYLGFSVCSLSFLVHFVLVPFHHSRPHQFCDI